MPGNFLLVLNFFIKIKDVLNFRKRASHARNLVLILSNDRFDIYLHNWIAQVPGSSDESGCGPPLVAPGAVALTAPTWS